MTKGESKIIFPVTTEELKHDEYEIVRLIQAEPFQNYMQTLKDAMNSKTSPNRDDGRKIIVKKTSCLPQDFSHNMSSGLRV